MGAYIHETSVAADCELADTARVYQHCNVRRSVLLAGASVGDFSRLSDCRLREGAMLQRNAMAYGMELGRHSYTGRGFTAWHCRIGAFCSISWNVSIGGANHDYTRTTTHAFLYAPEFGFLDGREPGYDRFTEPCVVGNDVWIAADVCICRGVTVGDGAVIGAGSVVTEDVPSYTVVAGAPARPIRKRFPDDVAELLLESRWWELPDAVIREHFDLFNAHPDRETAEKIRALQIRTEKSDRYEQQAETPL